MPAREGSPSTDLIVESAIQVSRDGIKKREGLNPEGRAKLVSSHAIDAWVSSKEDLPSDITAYSKYNKYFLSEERYIIIDKNEIEKLQLAIQAGQLTKKEAIDLAIEHSYAFDTVELG